MGYLQNATQVVRSDVLTTPQPVPEDEYVKQYADWFKSTIGASTQRDLTHAELIEINDAFKKQSPELLEKIFSQIDDKSLRHLASEMGKARFNGPDAIYDFIHRFGANADGLTGEEKADILDFLGKSLSSKQMARMGRALMAEDEGIAKTEFTAAIDKLGFEKFKEVVLELSHMQSPLAQHLETKLSQEARAQNSAFRVDLASYQPTGLHGDYAFSIDYSHAAKDYNDAVIPNKLKAHYVKEESRWEVSISDSYADGNLTITQTPDGGIRLSADNEILILPKAKNLLVSGSSNGDRIIADHTVKIPVTIAGNSGDDSIVVQTNSSTKIDGGFGNDTIYGGTGATTITDKQGINFLASGGSKTTIQAGGDHNVINAVRGTKEISQAGNGSAKVYTGTRATTIQNSTVKTEIYSQQPKKLKLQDASGHGNRKDKLWDITEVKPTIAGLGDSFKAAGSMDFNDRLNMDLDLLRASPYGQQMLGVLDASGHTVRNELITEQQKYDSRNTTAVAITFANRSPTEVLTLGLYTSDGRDSTVGYDPLFSGFGGNNRTWESPLNWLYHEYGHAFNNASNTMYADESSTLNNKKISEQDNERQVVGLDTNSPALDFDNDPSTPPTTHNPVALTENGLLEEMGLTKKSSYI